MPFERGGRAILKGVGGRELLSVLNHLAVGRGYVAPRRPSCPLASARRAVSCLPPAPRNRPGKGY